MVNKRNLKSGLADGLTEIGLSQVKAEVGSSSSAGHSLEVYVPISETFEAYLLNPETKKTYQEELIEHIPMTEEEAIEVINGIASAYDLIFIDTRGSEEPTDEVGLLTTGKAKDLISLIKVGELELPDETHIYIGKLISGVNADISTVSAYGVDVLDTGDGMGIALHEKVSDQTVWVLNLK